MHVPAAPLDTIHRLGARYSEHHSQRRPFRTGLVSSHAGYFPHPNDIAPLLELLSSKLHLLWQESLTDSEDCRIAAFAMFGVLMVRPYDTANARTAVNFAQYLLMQRWQTAPVPVHPDAHRFLSDAFSSVEQLAPCASYEELTALNRRVGMRIITFNLTERSAPFEFVAQYLLQRKRFML